MGRGLGPVPWGVVFPRTIKRLVPMGGAGDDWAAGGRFATLLADTSVREIVFDGGATYSAQTVLDICALRGSAPLRLTGNGSAIVSTIAATVPGAPTNSVFRAFNAPAAGTTLAVDTVAGSRTIHTVADVTPGTVILVGSFQRTVLSSTHGADYALYLDDPMYRVLPAGTAVVPSVVVTDLAIDDFVISGSGDRAAEIIGLRCQVSRIRVPDGATFGGPVCSFDIPSRDCIFEDMDIVAPDNTIGLFLEHNTRGRILRSKVRGGFRIDSGEYCEVRDCHSVGAGVGYLAATVAGIQVYSETALARNASIGCKIVGSTFNGGLYSGILLVAATDTTIESCECNDNTQYGCYAQGGTAKALNLTARRNANGGVRLSISAVAGMINSTTVLTNVVTANNATFGTGVDANCTASISNLQSTDDAGFGLSTNGTTQISGFVLNTTINSTAYAGLLVSAGVCVARGLDFTVVNDSRGIIADGTARLRVSDYRINGNWYPIVVPGVGSLPHVWLGPGMNFTGAALACFDQPGGSYSRGEVTLVAGTKDLLFRGATAYSRARITRKTPGGTLGHLSYVPAAGKITVNSSEAADTSVVVVEVVDNDSA